MSPNMAAETMSSSAGTSGTDMDGVLWAWLVAGGGSVLDGWDWSCERSLGAYQYLIAL